MKMTIFVLGMMFSSLSFAHAYTCTNNNLTRKISVVHEPGAEVPCRVKYEKPDEGADVQYPWSAGNQAGYCKDKADYLADRLRSLNWKCEFEEAG